MRPCVQQLIKVVVGPKAFGHELYSGEEVEAAKKAFMTEILDRVNTMLKSSQYLVTAMEPTVVDIMFYNEISTALMLTRIKGFKRADPNVEPWLMAMGEIEELSN